MNETLSRETEAEGRVSKSMKAVAKEFEDEARPLWTGTFPDSGLISYLQFTHGYRPDLKEVVGQLDVSGGMCPIIVREANPVTAHFEVKNGVMTVTLRYTAKE